MKHMLDQFMQARSLDAFVVTGGEEYNVIRDYLTNGAHITGGTIIKRPGQPLLLVVGPMESRRPARAACPCGRTMNSIIWPCCAT